MNVETNLALSASATSKGCVGPKHPFLWAALLLIVVLAILYHQAFRPGYVAYSNDGPYGLQAAECNSMPSSFKGVWSDIGWLGNEGIGASPDVRTLLMSVLPLRAYMNVFYPVALFLAGMAVCFCLRQFKLAPIACVLAALAAALNSDFLSTASWGVAPQIISFAANYVAIGLLAGMSGRRRWVRIILAGLCVGLGVSEGFDNGAIFSLFTAAFALYQALFLQEGSTGKKLARGLVRIGVVAVFAGLISVHVLSLLVGTQIRGVAGTAQDEETKKQRWAYSTQFSFPEAETLSVAVPGLFGYRNVWHMYDDNQPTDDQYWGTIGTEPTQGMWRLTGTGFYAGVLVVVVALWSVTQSFRKRGSPYTDVQRRTIWFWAGVLVAGLLLAYGKFAPFFRLFYALPYASTIRNPVKFMHVFSWALVVLFGYGVHGLAVTYLQNATAPVLGVIAQFKKWRSSATSFERKWMNGLFIAVGVALLGWFLYAGKNSSLKDYLQTVGISAAQAPGIADFSLKAVGWFVLFLALTTGLLALIFSGQFAGRAKWAGIVMGLLLVIDLGRADLPWIVYYDMNYKFADDPIVNFLSDKPYEHRVARMQVPIKTQQEALLINTYGSHWNQHLFPARNIQTLDMAQEPRVAVGKERFLTSMPQQSGLQYVLSNTRYLLGPSYVAKQINDQAGRQVLRNVKTFNFVPKGAEPKPDAVDWITKEDPNGELAIIEYNQALPRAKLYANWQVITNDDDTLRAIGSQGFDPHQTVLVADPIAKPEAGATNPPDDAVKITSYKSKQIELETDAKVPTVLLTVERYHPKWRVWVDGNPAAVLRTNFIERGVYLPAGKHIVVFKFEPSMTTFYTSLAGVILGLVLCGWLAIDGFRSKSEESASAAASSKSKSKQG